MKTNPRSSMRSELEDLRERLREAEETLNAIRGGEVDALVVAGPSGEKIFTLKGAEHPYRVLVESMNEGAISLSTAGVILYSNSAFARMTGVPLYQIMGSDLEKFVAVPQRELLKQLIEQSRRQAIRAEVTVQTKSGDELPTQFSFNPIALEEGPSVGVIVTDLSDRKRNEQAEAALKIRDEFIAIASHELRTPLSALVLRLGLLEGQAIKGDLTQVTRSVGRAQDQAQRITLLVDRLLNVSLLANGRIELELSTWDLGEIVKSVAERFLEQASNVGSDLRLSVTPGTMILADKLRLEEAISNVIANAVKFGAGKPIEIELTSTCDNVTLSVRDRGIGIPPDDLSRIFGRFERTSKSQPYGGLGLGLYIASQIVEQHKGSIRAENRPDGGACVIIELPRLTGKGRRNNQKAS
jgi:PAS domain S-box-containing protein